MSIASRITSMEDHIKESYQELKGLGIDINVNKNLKNIPILLDNYWETLPKVSGSGTDITLNNTKEGKMKIQLKGDTSQNGTPTPTYPQNIEVVTGNQNILVQNKNLASLKTSSSQTIAGLPFTIENGIFKVNGTANSNGGFYFDSFRANSGTATFTFEITGYTKGGSNNGSVILQVSDDNTTFTNLSQQYFSSPSASVQVTLDSTKYYRIRPYFASGNVFSNSTLKIQLEYGNTKTDFVEHQEQNHEINLGKNLINSVGYNKGANSSGTIVDTNTTYLSIEDYVKVQPNTTYTISFEDDDSSATLYSSTKDIDGNFIERVSLGATRTFTTGNNVYYIFLYLNKTGANFTSGGWVQLERGSQATSYSAYFTPIELCKIGDYQDTIIGTPDNWKIHREIGKITLNGSEAGWGLSATDTNTYRFALDNILSDDDKAYSFSTSIFMNNYFQEYAGNTGLANVDTDGIAIRNNFKGFGVRMSKTIVSDLPTFKTWLGNHNTIVYYVLATAIEETITDTELIGQLNNLAYGSSYNGQTNVNSSGNIASLLNANAIQG